METIPQQVRADWEVRMDEKLKRFATKDDIILLQRELSNNLKWIIGTIFGAVGMIIAAVGMMLRMVH